MQDCRARYNSAVSIDDDYEITDNPADMLQVQGDTREGSTDDHLQCGIDTAPQHAVQLLTHSKRFEELASRGEHSHLMRALIRAKSH